MRKKSIVGRYCCRPVSLLAAALLSLNVQSAVIDEGDYAVIGANDLGMHCADLDYRIFSILPPFNVVHAQVIQKGDANNWPVVLSNNEVEVFYSAASSPNDPAGANSINTTSANLPGIFKTNFWQPTGKTRLPGNAKLTFGGKTYAPLYPSVLAGLLLDPPVDLSSVCRRPNLVEPGASTGCPSILEAFETLPVDLGLPVPELGLLGNGTLKVEQQTMPGLANTPQPFHRYAADQPFFTAFGFGQVVPDTRWFAAEGVPIMPVDDAGVANAYPLMKVAAHDKNSGEELASLDIVLPVASEADCQNCHADPDDAGNGSASTYASVAFDVVTEAGAPGPEKLQNAAKLNILRLHDAKHGLKYKAWNNKGKLVAKACDTSVNPNSGRCLARQKKVQCSRCHYTPALDLAQVGPVDEPALAPKGRQQTRHISMSRAMHGHHGNLPDFMGAPLFPEMPAPDDPLRTANQELMPVNAFENDVLNQTCYQCHPGKKTQCLRGAMFSGGVVCQDCHGNMAEVGNDFTMRVSDSNPGDFVLDGSLRVPWASEPGCQSCHTGDAVNQNHPANAIVASDGIRLLRAFEPTTIAVAGVADPVEVAAPIHSPDSPYAENQGVNSNGDPVATLYRLSTGHGGVKCQGCHNSTHAIWPIQNSFANDNLAAEQLQGHIGTLVECATCHGADSFSINDFRGNLDENGRMKGPHGMHPTNDPGWTHNHEDFVDQHGTATCKSCHGNNGQGTVLSVTAADRVLECDESSFPGCNETSQGRRINVSKDTEISCSLCHENKINEGGEDDD